MTTFLSQLSQTSYQGNVIIKIAGRHFSIYTPDSGLSIDPAYQGTVKSLSINPSQIDLRRVSSTIASFTFKLVDKNRVISELIAGDAAGFLEQEVEIWIGRIGVSMDFADYYALPKTLIKKVSYGDEEYSFSSVEPTARIAKAIYQAKTQLGVDILAATTEITTSGASLSSFPDSGFIKIDKEIISYAAIDVTNSRFLGCIRGEFNTVPAAHSSNADVFWTESIEGNPIDVMLQVLLSQGEGGAYDVLLDGCGLPESIVDVAGMLALKSEEFSSLTMRVFLYQIDSALKWLEDQILTPLNLRFTTSGDSKLTIKQTDRIAIRPANTDITDSTTKEIPKWDVDGTRVVNRIKVEWDYSEAVGKYLNLSTYRDADSISRFGERDELSFRFSGVRSDLAGQAWVDYFAARMLRRLADPTPEITLTTHIDKATYGPVDRVNLISGYLPAFDGSLSFANDLEVVSRGINWMGGEVQFRLAFVSATLNRYGFIAPSDLILTALDQKTVTIASGRGSLYQPGWKLRLWNEAAGTFQADPANEIESVSGDQITFKSAFSTPLIPGSYRLRFADYSDASSDQKRFAFINQAALSVFSSDQKRSYCISF